jgi:hypothetical protein
MSAVCLIDTTIFAEILNIPGMTSRRDEIFESLQQKIAANESLFLPMATIFETGNHIAQNGDGTQRRKCAELFVEQVQKALDGTIPFTPLSFPTSEDMQKWLADFPDSAMRKSGIGDLSIIHEWNRQCALNHGRRVYIWSLDEHLSGHDQPARI